MVWDDSHLGEANILGLLTEALTAEVKIVLADQTGLVLADAAIRRKIKTLALPKLLIDIVAPLPEAIPVHRKSPSCQTLHRRKGGVFLHSSYQLREPLP